MADGSVRTDGNGHNSAAANSVGSRVFVFGASGCGKTRFAKQLAERLSVPHVELDSLLWGPAWTMRDDAAYLAATAAVVPEPGWVIEGTFRPDVAHTVWPHADTVVWLDFRFTLVAARLLRRTIRRAVTRERLWHGNVEPLRDLVGRGSLLAWLWQSYPKIPGEVSEFEAEMVSPTAVFHRFTTPKEAKKWLRNVRGETA